MFLARMGNRKDMSPVHDIALVPVEGDLSVRTAPALRRTLEGLIAGGTRRIVLNMAEVPYIDSAGMGVIIGAVRTMRAQGGLLSLVNVSRDVMRTLKIARLVDYMPVSIAGERHEVPELDPSVLPLWRTTLPVDGNDLHTVRIRIEELARRLGFSHDDAFDLMLAAGEALGNAADHTCGDGILATVVGYPDRMIVEVTDCGKGFDPCGKAIARMSDEGCERGRGIRLMRLLVDSVSIASRTSGTGMVVRLTKLV